MTAFGVLHVCTGNICRSPMAERLTVAGLEARAGEQAARFDVASAGTWGLSGAPMDPSAAAVLASYGLDGSDFRARRLTAPHVDAADLVLCATREHRAAVLDLAPDAAGRTFTLRELARLTEGIDPGVLPDGDVVERAHVLVRAAAARRATALPDDPRDDDLADPYRAPATAFAFCAELVQHSLRGPLDLLAGPLRPARRADPLPLG